MYKYRDFSENCIALHFYMLALGRLEILLVMLQHLLGTKDLKSQSNWLKQKNVYINPCAVAASLYSGYPPPLASSTALPCPTTTSRAWKEVVLQPDTLNIECVLNV